MMNTKIIPENIFQETVKKENQNNTMFDKDSILYKKNEILDKLSQQKLWGAVKLSGYTQIPCTSSRGPCEVGGMLFDYIEYD